MPELPEVETTRRGIAPRLSGQQISSIRVREPRLRWPVPPELRSGLAGGTVLAVERRAKYLLLRSEQGTALIHLGMSGSLRFTTQETPLRPHDHVEFLLADGGSLRFNDPRRFGAVLWVGGDPLDHPLLASLGPEPLGGDFHGEYLHRQSRGRRAPVKPFIMDGRVVVGVGNIYASEALFRAGIDPRRAAGRISRQRLEGLVLAIREVLHDAIEAGGTTLRDFYNGDGKPGYFGREIQVYGRGGALCPACGSAIRQLRLAQRSTFYCPRCQR